MNYLLGKLEKMGYLIRRPDPRDPRSRLIEMTMRGHTVRRTMRSSDARIESELERDLGAKNLARLRQLLLALNNAELVEVFRRDTGQPALVTPVGHYERA